MQDPPRPADEPDRLQALRQLLILDTPPEERFDRLTAFAAEEFGVPTALLSLIDEDRQWFKSRVGMDPCETPRRISFCGHAILQNDIMVVPDAHQDKHFSGNPLVRYSSANPGRMTCSRNALSRAGTSPSQSG